MSRSTKVIVLSLPETPVRHRLAANLKEQGFGVCILREEDNLPENAQVILASEATYAEFSILEEQRQNSFPWMPKVVNLSTCQKNAPSAGWDHPMNYTSIVVQALEERASRLTDHIHFAEAS